VVYFCFRRIRATIITAAIMMTAAMPAYNAMSMLPDGFTTGEGEVIAIGVEVTGGAVNVEEGDVVENVACVEPTPR